ncbi:hypothetical protein [Saccharothrix sp. Mg75]|uniref:hypothetical protein n=1 Tax=Saccharothrix sp. Mg75 TaxID=3445357 RepID=UPI003EECA754
MAENQAGAVRETAREEGTAVAQHAGQAAGEVASTAREQAGHVAQEAKTQAKNVAHDVRQRIAGEADNQAQRVSQQINRIADELTSMADGSGPDSMSAGALRQVADTGRQAARFLDERGARGLLDGAQDFARRKPGTFLIGAAVAGFLVARVAKSASAASNEPQRGVQAGGEHVSGQLPQHAAPEPRYPQQRQESPQWATQQPPVAPGMPATPTTPVTPATPQFGAPEPEHGSLAPQVPGTVRPGGTPYVQR